MTFNFTTFDNAIQAKLNTASVNLSAQDYLLLAKAVQTAIETSEGVSLLELIGTANGAASLNAQGLVPASQLLLALPTQTGNSGKILSTDGATASWSNSVSLSTLSVSGDITVSDDLFVGPGAPAFHTTLTDSSGTFVVTSGQDSYGQLAFKNTEPTSSSDIIAYSAEGGDAAGWIDMGITGATFDSATYGITGPHDGYIFMQAVEGTDGAGNLVIATGANGTDNKIIFAAGGYTSGNTQMEITPDQNIHIEIPTPSTSPTTGALTVVGGVGIQGDMNINGDVSIQGTITFGGGGTTVETSNLAVTDPAVFVGTNNQSDIVDLAFVGEYATSVSSIVATVNNKALTNNVATLTTAANHTYLAGDVVTITGVDATFNGTYNIIDVPTTTTFTYAKTATNVTSAAVSPTGTATVNARRKFAGIARDASDGVIKAFKDATTKPTSTVNFSEAGLGFADIKVGGITADSIAVGNITNTEFGYLDGVTSGIQTQLDNKLSTSTAASTYMPLIQPIESSRTFTSNSYTLQAGDAYKVVLLSNNTTAGNIVIPNNVFTVGQTLTVVQTGSGQLTFTNPSVSLSSQGNKVKLNGQYAAAQLICTASNTFLLIGNLAV